jgi:CDP-glycerol glycerophosphotransferase (TagB/SpsB family)
MAHTLPHTIGNMKMVEEKIAEIKALEFKSLQLYAEVHTLVEQEMERFMYRCRNTETMQQNAQSYREKSERVERGKKKNRMKDKTKEEGDSYDSCPTMGLLSL